MRHFSGGDFKDGWRDFMNCWTVIAQVLGLLAMGTTVVSMQCRSNSKFFLFQEISGVLFAVSFSILGAWGGTLMNIFGIVRPELLRHKKFARSKLILCILLLLLALCIAALVFFTDEKYYLLLIVTAAQLIGTCVMWSQNGRSIRWGQLLAVSPLWIIYNILLPVPSIGGILTEMINIVSVCLALYRYRKSGFTAN